MAKCSVLSSSLFVVLLFLASSRTSRSFFSLVKFKSLHFVEIYIFLLPSFFPSSFLLLTFLFLSLFFVCAISILSLLDDSRSVQTKYIAKATSGSMLHAYIVKRSKDLIELM